MKRRRRSPGSHHLSPGVPLLMVVVVLVEHGRVQRHPPPGPVLAGEHHHGGLHTRYRLRPTVLHHMGRSHGEPVGVRVPGLQPAVRMMQLLLMLRTRTASLSPKYSHRRGGREREAPPTDGGGVSTAWMDPNCCRRERRSHGRRKVRL